METVKLKHNKAQFELYAVEPQILCEGHSGIQGWVYVKMNFRVFTIAQQGNKGLSCLYIDTRCLTMHMWSMNRTTYMYIHPIIGRV